MKTSKERLVNYINSLSSQERIKLFNRNGKYCLGNSFQVNIGIRLPKKINITYNVSFDNCKTSNASLSLIRKKNHIKNNYYISFVKGYCLIEFDDSYSTEDLNEIIEKYSLSIMKKLVDKMYFSKILEDSSMPEKIIYPHKKIKRDMIIEKYNQRNNIE